jgi:hypothetical protein
MIHSKQELDEMEQRRNAEEERINKALVKLETVFEEFSSSVAAGKRQAALALNQLEAELHELLKTRISWYTGSIEFCDKTLENVHHLESTQDDGGRWFALKLLLVLHRETMVTQAQDNGVLLLLSTYLIHALRELADIPSTKDEVERLGKSLEDLLPLMKILQESAAKRMQEQKQIKIAASNPSLYS